MKHESTSSSARLYGQVSLCVTACLIFSSVCSAQAVNRRGVTWVAPKSEILSLNNYEEKEETDAGGIRREYIRTTKDGEWIPFYTSERSVLVTLGHRRRLVLVNDCPATKSCKVMVVN